MQKGSLSITKRTRSIAGDDTHSLAMHPSSERLIKNSKDSLAVRRYDMIKYINPILCSLLRHYPTVRPREFPLAHGIIHGTCFVMWNQRSHVPFSKDSLLVGLHSPTTKKKQQKTDMAQHTVAHAASLKLKFRSCISLCRHCNHLPANQRRSHECSLQPHGPRTLSKNARQLKPVMLQPTPSTWPEP